MSWLKQDGPDTILTARVVPRASANAIVGPVGEALKIRLQAPPVDGKANQALTALLARIAGLPKSRIDLIAGETGRNKRVRLRRADAQTMAAALLNKPEAPVNAHD